MHGCTVGREACLLCIFLLFRQKIVKKLLKYMKCDKTL